jgi:hypothetical protein
MEATLNSSMWARRGILVVAIALGLLAMEGAGAAAALELDSGGQHRGAARTVRDPAASGGRAMMLYGRAYLRRPVDLTAFTSVRLRARALPCRGWPRIRLALSGAPSRTGVIRSRRWRTYSLPLSATAGKRVLGLRFANPRRARRCARGVVVDAVSFVPRVAAKRAPSPARIAPGTLAPTPTRTPSGPTVIGNNPDVGLASGQRFGFNDSGLVEPPLSRETFLGQLRDSHATLHRGNLNWAGWEFDRGQYSDTFWNRPDRDYRDELNQGVRQIITLLGTPYWALTDKGKGSSDPGGNWHCDGTRGSTCDAPPDVRDPSIRDAWMNWVRAVVTRYPQAAGIEIWNEPNLRWSWFQDQDPDLYALMVKSASDAVRSVDPNMPVLTGGMGPYLGTNTTEITSYKYMLDRIYAIAGASSFDAISWHAYACNRSSDTYYHDGVLKHLNMLRSIKQGHGDAAKPLWLTETGAPTGSPQPAACGTSFSEAQQRDGLTDLLDWLGQQQAQEHDLPVVLIHSLFDRHADGTSNVGQFGSVAWSKDAVTGNITTREKPGYAVVRCYYGGPC